jgi:hypothetical protein
VTPEQLTDVKEVLVPPTNASALDDFENPGRAAALGALESSLVEHIERLLKRLGLPPSEFSKMVSSHAWMGWALFRDLDLMTPPGLLDDPRPRLRKLMFLPRSGAVNGYAALKSSSVPHQGVPQVPGSTHWRVVTFRPVSVRRTL